MLYPSLLKSCAGREAGEFEAFERESGEEALGYARALRCLEEAVHGAASEPVIAHG